MQAYLLSALGAPSSSVGFFHLRLLPRPRVSNQYQSFHHHNQSKLNLHLHHRRRRRPPPSGGSRSTGVILASAAINPDHQDHYAVLDVSPTVPSTEIKRAYRRLARKYHPDVCKDSKSGEVFKSIRLAYDVLSNEETRAQYDYKLRCPKYSDRPLRGNWTYDAELEEEVGTYGWVAKMIWQMWREKYWQQYETNENSGESNTSEEKTTAAERGSFSEVLISAFFALFFVQNLGSQLYLFSRSWFALSDRKLDTGFKMGYVIAPFLGGRNGILLTLCLSFASWAFGKNCSRLLPLIVVAIWVMTNLVRHALIPQGALIPLLFYQALLFLFIKLQDDLK